MPIFSVSTDLCLKDGICATVCPCRVITAESGSFPTLHRGGSGRCIACGHCIAYCPAKAAHIDTLDEAGAVPLDPSILPDAASFSMLCKSRRSVRRFKKTPVPRDLILTVLEDARYAPSAKNMQPVRWVGATTPESVRAVGDHVADWFETLLADPEQSLAPSEARGLIKGWRTGADPLLRGAPALLLAVTPANWKWGETDAAIALTYVELSALGHGLGACWAGYVTAAARQYAPLRRHLRIAEDELVAGGQMLGFPALRPRVAPPRELARVEWL